MNNKLELMRKWSARAKNPIYKRCTAEFTSKRKKNCFCIQGLLLETIREDFGRGEWVDHNTFALTPDFYIQSLVDSFTYSLLCEKLGLDYDYADYRLIANMIELNDMKGYSLPQCADLIDAHFGLGEL